MRRSQYLPLHIDSRTVAYLTLFCLSTKDLFGSEAAFQNSLSRRTWCSPSSGSTIMSPPARIRPLVLATTESEGKHVEKVLFVECGFGADAHGQNATKAAVRACRNAIEFNQIPSIGDIIPGGRENMKLDVLLAVPTLYQPGLDLDLVRKSFPYGKARFHIQDGGMIANNGKVIEEMGDKNEDMIVVCVAVTVGY